MGTLLILANETFYLQPENTVQSGSENWRTNYDLRRAKALEIPERLNGRKPDLECCSAIL